MSSGLHCDATPRYPSKGLLYRIRRRCLFLFQNDFPGFIQNAVERPAISEIHTNGELAPFENLVCSPAHSASLLHSRSPFPCALSTFKHWERIASRRRPAFSSHLVYGITTEVPY